MNIIVCDDEKIFRDQVRVEVEEYFGKLDCTCIEYSDGTELVVAYKNGQQMDVIFLDIEMEKVDGMDAAKELRALGMTAPIVFLTSHVELAMEGYEVAAFRFLPKPIVKEKMTKALVDLKEELFEKQKIIIHYEGEDVVLFVDDIVYIEAMNNSISIVLTTREYTIRKKMSDMEQELAEISDHFFRIHRGYLINIAHVKKHQAKEVLLTKDVVLPISRSVAGDFKESLFEYIRNSAQ